MTEIEEIEYQIEQIKKGDLDQITKDKIIKEWRVQHPNGTKAQCIKDTKISKPTVYKYWCE